MEPGTALVYWVSIPNLDLIHARYLRPLLLSLEVRTLRAYNEETITSFICYDNTEEWIRTKERLVEIIERSDTAQAVLDRIPKGELIEFLCCGEDPRVWWNLNGPLTDKQLQEKVVKQCFEWAKHWNYGWC